MELLAWTGVFVLYLNSLLITWAGTEAVVVVYGVVFSFLGHSFVCFSCL